MAHRIATAQMLARNKNHWLHLLVLPEELVFLVFAYVGNARRPALLDRLQDEILVMANFTSRCNDMVMEIGLPMQPYVDHLPATIPFAHPHRWEAWAIRALTPQPIDYREEWYWNKFRTAWNNDIWIGDPNVPPTI